VCSDLTTHQRAFSEWAVAINTVMAADGMIYKQELSPVSYCHLMFPAIREETLKHPVLKDTSMGRVMKTLLGEATISTSSESRHFVSLRKHLISISEER
jgi:hypothetical protein